jgi:hypothetical protein
MRQMVQDYQPKETEEQVRFPKKTICQDLDTFVSTKKKKKRQQWLEKISQKLVSKRAKQSKQ